MNGPLECALVIAKTRVHLALGLEAWLLPPGSIVPFRLLASLRCCLHLLLLLISSSYIRY